MAGAPRVELGVGRHRFDLRLPAAARGIYFARVQMNGTALTRSVIVLK